MDVNNLLTILVLTVVMMSGAGFLMYLMSKLRNDRYDMELRKVQLDLVRKSLESKSYDINSQLMSDPKRWFDINHLLLEAQKYSSKELAVEDENGRADFLENSGVNLKNIKVQKKKVFVLTPFHPRYEETYSTIKRTCTKIGLECTRGDEEFRPGVVLSHILEKMLESSIVIANIDGRNPNVYYELGIAHAMGKRTILIASDIDKVSFDLQSQRIVVYKTQEDLEAMLTSYLARSVVEG